MPGLFDAIVPRGLFAGELDTGAFGGSASAGFAFFAAGVKKDWIVRFSGAMLSEAGAAVAQSALNAGLALVGVVVITHRVCHPGPPILDFAAKFEIWQLVSPDRLKDSASDPTTRGRALRSRRGPPFATRPRAEDYRARATSFRREARPRRFARVRHERSARSGFRPFSPHPARRVHLLAPPHPRRSVVRDDVVRNRAFGSPVQAQGVR